MIGIILMSYGSPNRLSEVEKYFTHILQGNTPPKAQLNKVYEMYRSLETYDVLGEVTERQAQAVQTLLQQQLLEGVRVYAAFKHAEPFVEDIVERLLEENCSRIVALPLAPISSKGGIDGYTEDIKKTLEKYDRQLPIDEISNWHNHPELISVISRRVKKAVEWITSNEVDPAVIFTAHSQRGPVEKHMDYSSKFNECSVAIASKLNLTNWATAYRSYRPNQSIWLGPYLHDVIDEKIRNGSKGFVLCDLSSLTENAEVLKEIGEECQSDIQEKGLEYVRTEFLNDSADYMMAVATIIKEHLTKNQI